MNMSSTCPGRATSPAPGSMSGGGCWRQGCTAITRARRDETDLRASPPPPLRRLAERGVEMFQPRQHFLFQELQRVVPRFTLVLVVEAEHQPHAEAADLARDLLDLFGDGGGRADDPVAP